MNAQKTAFFSILERFRCSGAVLLVCSCTLFLFTNMALGRGSAPIYEDPFDVAAGGASLTRASQAGMIFSNPALMPYGTGFHRWLGNETSLIVGKNSIDFAKSLSAGSSASESTSNIEQNTSLQFVDQIKKNPVHAGVLNSFSYINRFVGFSVFNRAEFDLSAVESQEITIPGLPEIPALRLRSESYQGVALSAASMLFSEMLSIGATAKFVYAGEPDKTIELSDQQAINDLQSPSGLRSLVLMNTGYGYDAGLVFFKQGPRADYRLALKIDDIGTTKLSGEADLKELKQMYHVGVGYTLHNAVDSLHLSVDYRDIRKASDDGLFKRLRWGAKLLLRQHIGISAGYYDGSPSYGLELDLWIARITAVYYKRELGAKHGSDARPVYLVGLSMGI